MAPKKQRNPRRKPRGGSAAGGAGNGGKPTGVGGWDNPGPPANQFYFNEPTPSPDPTHFNTPVVDKQYYDKQYLINSVQPVPAPRSTAPMLLADIVGQEKVDNVKRAGRIVFHSVGDTGPVKGPTSLSKVADRMVEDFTDGPPNQPAFFFHLGDVVYNFGEEEYYYEQFYEPYREYPGPIFAIPGNHDGMIYRTDKYQSLQAFQKHFCSDVPRHAPEAAGLQRTTMMQPGVYFTLQAPFVTIIGLYSNVLENYGVISSEGGVYKAVDDAQKQFLIAQLKSAKQEGGGAVIVATHHPPFSGDGMHGGSPEMLKDLDDCMREADCYAHAIFSGHAHIYQRYTRTLKVGGKNFEVPYVVAGSGGHAVTPPRTRAIVNTRTPKQTDGVRMEKYIADFGYLRVTATAQKLMIEFYEVSESLGGTKSATDRCVVDLATHTLMTAPIV